MSAWHLRGGYLVLFGPIALLIGRDAVRHGRDGWLWGLLFLWQPVLVGLSYLVIRRRPLRRRRPASERTFGYWR